MKVGDKNWRLRAVKSMLIYDKEWAIDIWEFKFNVSTSMFFFRL